MGVIIVLIVSLISSFTFAGVNQSQTNVLVMETGRKSWHSVNPVLCDAPRCCVFNYYFSEQSPEDEDYFHTASLFFNRLFKARPEQKIRRAIASVRDALLGR